MSSGGMTVARRAFHARARDVRQHSDRRTEPTIDLGVVWQPGVGRGGFSTQEDAGASPSNGCGSAMRKPQRGFELVRDRTGGLILTTAIVLCLTFE